MDVDASAVGAAWGSTSAWEWLQLVVAAVVVVAAVLHETGWAVGAAGPGRKGATPAEDNRAAEGCTLPGCVRCTAHRAGAQPEVDPVNQQPTVCMWPGLAARPVWREFPRQAWMGMIHENYVEVVTEARELLDVADAWQDTPLVTGGAWGNASLVNQGRVHPHIPHMAPVTWRAVEAGIAEGDVMGTGTALANVFFSRVVPAADDGWVHITPHHGPTNARLRCQIPLIQPAAPPPGKCGSEAAGGDGDRDAPPVTATSRLVVAGRGYTPQPPPSVFVFDDSYLHSVDARGLRVVLVVDLWHPELTPLQRGEIEEAYPVPA